MAGRFVVFAGVWRRLHYAAKCFYEPLLVAMVPGHNRFGTDGQLLLKAVNDSNTTQNISIVMRALTITGKEKKRWEFNVIADSGFVTKINSLNPQEIPDDCFLHWRWNDDQNMQLGQNEYWPMPYKNYQLPEPKVTIEEHNEGNKLLLKLTTDQPAFFVTINLGGRSVYSHNGFTLLPGEPREITVSKTLESERVPETGSYTIQHL